MLYSRPAVIYWLYSRFSELQLSIYIVFIDWRWAGRGSSSSVRKREHKRSWQREAGDLALLAWLSNHPVQFLGGSGLTSTVDAMDIS